MNSHHARMMTVEIEGRLPVRIERRRRLLTVMIVKRADRLGARSGRQPTMMIAEMYVLLPKLLTSRLANSRRKPKTLGGIGPLHLNAMSSRHHL